MPNPAALESLDAVMDNAMQQAALAVGKGIDAASLLGWPEDKLEALYALGRDYYQRGDYAAAEQVMGWLARAKGHDARILKALAAARKMQGKYEAAVNAYSLAAMADLEDPEPSFYAAECLFHLGDAARTRSALEAARQQAEHKHDTRLIARIDAMTELLNRDGTTPPR